MGYQQSLRAKITAQITKKKSEAKNVFKTEPSCYFVTTMMDKGSYKSAGGRLSIADAEDLHFDYMLHIQKHLIPRAKSDRAKGMKPMFLFITETVTKYGSELMPHCHGYLWINPNIPRLGSNPLGKLQELTESYNELKGRQYQWSHTVADLKPADNSSRLLSYSTKGLSRFHLSQNEEVAFFDENSLEPFIEKRKTSGIYHPEGIYHQLRSNALRVN